MRTIQVHTFSRWLCPVDGYTALNNCIFEFKIEFEEEHLKLLGILTNLSFGSGAHFDLSFQREDAIWGKGTRSFQVDAFY